MKSVAKLIHQSNMTYIPTKLPVQFYGLPDGKVYIIYARFCAKSKQKTEIEFVLAKHNEFGYNYEEEQLIPKVKVKCPVYREMVDKPNPKFEIIKVDKQIKTYSEAVSQLNRKARGVISKAELL